MHTHTHTHTYIHTHAHTHTYTHIHTHTCTHTHTHSLTHTHIHTLTQCLSFLSRTLHLLWSGRSGPLLSEFFGGINSLHELEKKAIVGQHCML